MTTPMVAPAAPDVIRVTATTTGHNGAPAEEKAP